MSAEYPCSCFTFNYKLLILYFKLLRSNFYLLLFCSLPFYELFIIYTVYLFKIISKKHEHWLDLRARRPEVLRCFKWPLQGSFQLLRGAPQKVSCLPPSHLPEQTRRSKLPQHSCGSRGTALYPAGAAGLTWRWRSPSREQPCLGPGLPPHGGGLQPAAGLLRGSRVAPPGPTPINDHVLLNSQKRRLLKYACSETLGICFTPAMIAVRALAQVDFPEPPFLVLSWGGAG